MIIYSAVSTVILILCYIFFGQSVLKYADQAKSEFKATQNQLLESQKKVSGLPDPRKAIEEIEKKSQEFKEMGLSKKQLPRITQLLGQTATGRNINVISIRPRDDIKSGGDDLPSGVTKVYMEIVLSCNYQELADYVKSLSGLQVSFALESLTITRKQEDALSAEPKSPGKNTGQSAELQANLILSTYMALEL